MFTTAAVLLLSLWTASGTGTQLNRSGPPRNCQDIIQLGNIYEGHYVVYVESETSANNEAIMIYCSQEDGMEVLLSDREKVEPARNCLDLLQNGMTANGQYIIYPHLNNPTEPALVSCDQETDGGGWAIIQKRYDGSEDFFKTWTEYEDGFGNPNTEHYLGNKIISSLTEQSVNELMVVLEDWEDVMAYAHYQAFHIDVLYDYELDVFSYNGTAGDSLHYHTGRSFTTFDVDHDEHEGGNCASFGHGAWWYGSCYASNLNGRYYPSADTNGQYDSMNWRDFRGFDSLKSSKMMVRPNYG